MLKPITMEWIQLKVGALFLTSAQMEDEIRELSIKNTELVKKVSELEKQKEGSILDE